MAHANDVASYLISLRNSDEKTGKHFSLSNLKLQKLLYFCQGLHFAVDNREPLIEDSNFEAWPYGPVIPTIYSRFSKYGQNDIPLNEATNYNLNEQQINTINLVWNLLKNRHAFDLVDATHVEDSPWYNVYHNQNDNNTIDNAAIQNYFLNIGAGAN